MGQTNANTYVLTIVNGVPAANQDFVVDLPAGTYYMSVTVRSSVTGATTVVGTLVPFVDNERRSVGPALYFVAPADGSSTNQSFTLPAGAAARFATISAAAVALGGFQPVTVPHGLRLSVTKGGATTGQLLTVEITATRIG